MRLDVLHDTAGQTAGQASASPRRSGPRAAPPSAQVGSEGRARTAPRTARAFLAIAIAAGTVGQAAAQSAVPAGAEPIDGLLARAPDWQPMPRSRPTLAQSFASDCQPPDPELAWFRLPASLRAVPIEAMIGQLLVVSYGGTQATDPGVRLARDAIARSRIGGVLTFRHNIASANDITAVNETFADANEAVPAMVAVDQEGGLVMRVKPSEGAPATPSAADIAAGSPADARAAYDEMAASLAQLGFTANFGPVVDLAINPNNPVIARFGRSYGADPATVARYATIFAQAHREAGVGTALKHFPGHGSSSDDSHEGAIDLSPTWSRAELVPFRDMIAAREADMIMIGHLTLDGLTDDGLPASLSGDAIDGFLRETLCYAGVVVSDDLAMDAISATWEPVRAVTMMVEAGGDIALLSLSAGQGYEMIDRITQALTERAAASPDFADRIRHAYARVVNLKLDLAETRASAHKSDFDTATLQGSAASRP